MPPEENATTRSPWAVPNPIDSTQQPREADLLEDTIPLPAYRPERLI